MAYGEKALRKPFTNNGRITISIVITVDIIRFLEMQEIPNDMTAVAIPAVISMSICAFNIS